jgi:hypothetical protein
MRLVLRGNLHQIRGAITTDYEDITIDGEVFAISASNIKANGTWGQGLEERLNDWPWFVPGGREM